MHCNIMKCAHNILTHYHVTMDIPSKVFTYCGVIMSHVTKINSCHYMISTKGSAQKGISLEIWVWRFHSKQAIAWHNVIDCWNVWVPWVMWLTVCTYGCRLSTRAATMCDWLSTLNVSPCVIDSPQVVPQCVTDYLH